ncbi:D-alanyl-D-alanine carboxypeptidase/D-alanyl-D-alanine-endopeptidase [Nocardioides sp. dk4132]|nr:D-alanyl-D-alanine carboxypeptidase/D-alanyl-D-alanine-endopeptidase [Nocardioides sp. dk4132]
MADVAQVLQARVGRRDAEDLVVAAGLVGHAEHADRAAADQAAREGRLLQQHEGVERVAVLAEGLLDVAVVGRVLRRREERAVQAQPAGLVVHLVLVPLALGDLHQHVELEHVIPPRFGSGPTGPHGHGQQSLVGVFFDQGVTPAGDARGQSRAQWPQHTLDGSDWVPRRDRRHGGAPEAGRAATWLVLLLVLVLGVGGVATYRFQVADDLLDDWLGPREAASPAEVAPPDGIELGAVEQPSPLARPAVAGQLDPRAVRRVLEPELRDEDLGPHVLAAVAPIAGGAPVVVRRGSATAIPASTTKLLTSLAALAALDPDTGFETRVLQQPDNGSGPARITLVGGGDPLLASRPVEATGEGEETRWPPRADVVTLAKETAAALAVEGRPAVRVSYDDFLFTGPSASTGWEPGYVPDGVVAPIGALWVDGGRPENGFGRVADPARAAADEFVAALRRAGVRVLGEPEHRRAGADAAPLASVTGPTLRQLVEHLLLVSDNETTEVVLRHVGLAVAGTGSFEAGTAAVLEVLADLGVPTTGARIFDGSGLSRENRLRPETLLGVLRVAATHPREDLASLLSGLPVAAFSGSLTDRFDTGAPEGRGRVRAKTGTLTNVSSLAGTVTTLDGVPVVFVLMTDKVAVEDTLEARDALDEAAAALGACRCAGSS